MATKPLLSTFLGQYLWAFALSILALLASIASLIFLQLSPAMFYTATLGLLGLPNLSLAWFVGRGVHWALRLLIAVAGYAVVLAGVWGLHSALFVGDILGREFSNLFWMFCLVQLLVWGGLSWVLPQKAVNTVATMAEKQTNETETLAS
jgi:hypothetical protein